MPELPEVETIARELNAALVGAEFCNVRVLDSRAVSSGDGALAEADLPATVNKARVLRVWRRAKVLVVDLALPEHGLLPLCCHLRMTGRLTVDVRRFGCCRAMSPEALCRWKFWAALGPEPLELSAAAFADLFAGRKARVKALLLDQHFIAGIGNIYADESLFRAGIRPDALAHHISRPRLEGLYVALVEVLREAIAANGSSISDYVGAHGDAGAFQNDFRVYGRAGQPCRVCQTVLTRHTVAGRTTVCCPRCQK